jgi:hypothetical protein
LTTVAQNDEARRKAAEAELIRIAAERNAAKNPKKQAAPVPAQPAAKDRAEKEAKERAKDVKPKPAVPSKVERKISEDIAAAISAAPAVRRAFVSCVTSVVAGTCIATSSEDKSQTSWQSTCTDQGQSCTHVVTMVIVCAQIGREAVLNNARTTTDDDESTADVARKRVQAMYAMRACVRFG